MAWDFVNYEELVKKNREEGAVNPNILIHRNAVIKVGRVMEEDGSYTYKYEGRICNRIKITAIKNDFQTKEKTCTLEYLNLSGNVESRDFLCDVISDKQKIVSLSKYGVDVNSNNAKGVLDHLNNELRKAKEEKATKHIGIIPYKGKFLYVGAHCFWKNKDVIKKVKLCYNGKLNIGQKGSYKSYKRMIDRDVITSIPMSTALAIGCSSLLVGYIGEICQINNLFVHIFSDSSCGKTTALQIAISPFGSSKNENGRNSLCSSWHATDNAKMEMLAGNSGIPIGFDESGVARNKNYATTIYSLAEGKEKQRLEYGVGNKDVREWHTTIISTGEHPLDDDTDRATGQKVRMISFEGVKWTKNAEHSERIKKTICKHHGWLGELFAKELLSHDPKFWEIKHSAEVQKELEMLQCGNLNQRLADSIAMIVIAAKILTNIGIEVSIDGIRDFVITNVNKTTGVKSAIGEKAYEKICAEISSKRNQIELRGRNGIPIQPVVSGTIWGVSYKFSKSNDLDDVDLEEVCITKEDVDNFLNANGFRNPQVIYNQWKENGHLEVDSRGGIIHKVKLGGMKSARCIRIKVE